MNCNAAAKNFFAHYRSLDHVAFSFSFAPLGHITADKLLTSLHSFAKISFALLKKLRLSTTRYANVELSKKAVPPLLHKKEVKEKKPHFSISVAFSSACYM